MRVDYASSPRILRQFLVIDTVLIVTIRHNDYYTMMHSVVERRNEINKSKHTEASKEICSCKPSTITQSVANNNN